LYKLTAQMNEQQNW